MAITQSDIRRGIEELQLAGLPVCVHSSLGSFGHVEGGADAVIDAFLDSGCTMVVPTFDYANELATPQGVEIRRNGWDQGDDLYTNERTMEPYDSSASHMTVDDLGAIPAALVARPERVRGAHPIDSFSAVGPLAQEIIGTQTPQNTYGPLRAIGERGGFVLLIGVGLNRMTLLHTAEQKSGRELFHRWAVGPEGELVETIVGGCSEGFHALEPAIDHLAREIFVGESRWRAFPIRETLTAAAAAIEADPHITHCGDLDCDDCRDAVQGGPIVPASARFFDSSTPQT